MRAGGVWRLVLGVWLSALCSLPVQAGTAFHYEHAVLIRVVDGDTARLDVEIAAGLIRKDVSCRLLRINAPEINTVEGVAAKNALAAFLLGKTLRVDHDKPDAFGRWLIELWADGMNVSDWLMANGYVKPY